ncbi:MAG: invasion associated locus B family protein [Gemmobacter sp.]
MKLWVTGAAVAAMLALTGIASAQESTNRVATRTDWSVFTEASPRECWGVSAPKQTVNTRDGRPVSVRRGDIFLFVTFRPGTGAAGEISFTGGYPFAPNSTVSVQIGSDRFELFTDNEWAWPQNAQADAALLAAMKRGTEAVLTARSARGTQTVDTFSLLGFTAAMTEAEARCK